MLFVSVYLAMRCCLGGVFVFVACERGVQVKGLAMMGSVIFCCCMCIILLHFAWWHCYFALHSIVLHLREDYE